MGSCAAPSAKGDDKFITTDYLQQCQPDRFDGRDGPVWGQEYSWNLAKDRLQDLEKYGKAYVSRHEDRMGEGFSFGPDLLIIR
ncbi:hypothetical protein [Salmonella enterica]|uniref:hypothetical protein n=1 Tax=Salmonella enterica TaxID=28901 RepID=UPI0020C42194|nr:hypothetical protein [Salmonella enterica]UTL37986.1 hypothetical protein NL730_24330 [Salmonella enterica subsp. enterica serovar Typhimurium]